MACQEETALKATVLLETPFRVQPVELAAGRSLLFGRGRSAQIDTKDPTVAERHLQLTYRDESLTVEAVTVGASVRVNEVPVSSGHCVEAGDEVGFGKCRLVVMAVGTHAPRPVRPYIFGYEEALGRLHEALARATPERTVGVMLVGIPHLNTAARSALTRRVIDESVAAGVSVGWGEYAPDVLVAIAPEVDAEQWAPLTQRLAASAGPRAVVGTAAAPEDGLHAEVLVERAMNALLAPAPPQEPVWGDPVMIRLAELARRVGERLGLVVVCGPAGSGRRTLARVMAAAAEMPSRVVREPTDVAGVVAVVPPPFSAMPELVRWAQTAAERGGKVVLIRDRPLPSASMQLEVPPLWARPADVRPLAETFLAEARTRVGRPRLVLAPEAEVVLAAWRWPGQVTELRNVMVRAARAAVRDEVGRDALPGRLSVDSPLESLGHSLQAAERELVLEALARTRWNVTAAAARLGQPRRTLVYRLAKLGLKRPTRSRAP